MNVKSCDLLLFFTYSKCVSIKINIIVEATRGAGAQSLTVKTTGHGFDTHSRVEVFT